MIIRVFKRPVEGGHINVPLDLADLDLTGDLLADGGVVPSLIGLVGELIAITSEAYDIKDADYRHWRAGQIKAAIESGSTVTAAKDTFERDKQFRIFKHALARLGGDLEFLKRYHAALECKASMVRGRIELVRADVHGTTLGLDVRSRPAANTSRVKTRETKKEKPAPTSATDLRRKRQEMRARRATKES